jgi:hypothetical protein
LLAKRIDTLHSKPARVNISLSAVAVSLLLIEKRELGQVINVAVDRMRQLAMF